MWQSESVRGDEGEQGNQGSYAARRDGPSFDGKTGELARAHDAAWRRVFPRYEALTTLAADLALAAFRDGTSIVDAGCATGDLIDRLARRLARASRTVRFVGIEPDQALRTVAEERLWPWLGEHEVHLRAAPPEECDYRDASVVVATFAFAHAGLVERRRALARMAQGLLPGGLLVLADFYVSRHDAVREQWAQRLARAEGAMSTDERQALARHVLGAKPRITWAEQLGILEDVGFSRVEPIMAEDGFLAAAATKEA